MLFKFTARLATIVVSLGALLLIGGVAQGGVSMHEASASVTCTEVTAHLTNFENPTTVIHAQANGVALPDQTLKGASGDVTFPWTPKVGVNNTVRIFWTGGEKIIEVSPDCPSPTTTTTTAPPMTTTTQPGPTPVPVQPRFTG